MQKIPKTMSSQHPDNVNTPFFAQSPILDGEHEIEEAFYAFTHLDCDEQMWDYEGKEVDSFVVKKLLTKYSSYLQEKRLGRDIFLTLRVPNPNFEKAEAKVLLETLESIPRSFDAAKLIYKDDIPPIFEIILPMTSTARSLDRIYHYYKDFVVGKQDKRFIDDEITIAEWIGEFKPKKINVIPLFEDKMNMLNAADITREFIKDKDISYQRVFLARSDPAQNYGLVSAVLINKIALQRLYILSKEMAINIYPIIGVGSAPFRGNLKPDTCERVMYEYPYVTTYTIQSSFKYDYPFDEVRKAIKLINKKNILSPREIDEALCLEIIENYSRDYQKHVIDLTAIINEIAKFIPSRRARKLHIGLFGYSRSLEQDPIQYLPRAISFTAGLYSLGLPPELIGLTALTEDDMTIIKKYYINLEQDLKDAFQYYNPDSPFIPEDLKLALKDFPLDYEINKEHQKITSEIAEHIRKKTNIDLSQLVLRAANTRRFLG
ncbi:MAG: phosphoenolpyruvate carboxylase [Candidatus Lokiarchaeota archaeon]|nr:phosphoenolpyruvate carboxylase [Candidatus Lokiarchaeota archaeon]